MPLIIPAGFAQVTFQFSTLSTIGSKAAWTFGMDRPPSAEAAAEIADWWNDSYKVHQSPGAILERIVMKSDVGEYTEEMGLPGTGGGSFAAPQIAALVQKRTGLVGRANRGRCYWPAFVRESEVDSGGVIDGSSLADYQAIADELVTRLAVLGAQMQIFHNDVSDPTPVTSFQVSGQTATVRRRNRR